MKEGWTDKPLGDACDVVNGGTPQTDIPEYWGGSNLWITPAEMGKRLSPYIDDTERKISDLGLRNSSARLLPPNSIILSSRAPIGYLVINTKPMATNQGCKGLIPGKQLEHKFLYYYLVGNVDLLNSLGNGATFKELSGGRLKEVRIPIPPLPEQQRIVTLLDEAFAGIATLKANAQKNLQNAHESFESYLHSILANPGDGWEEKKLGECFKLKSGDSITSKMMSENGKFPVYGGNGIVGRYDKFNLSGSNIVIGRVGALCGNARHIKERIWLTDNAFKIAGWNCYFDHDFLTYLLNFKKLRSYARQAAQPVISNSSLESVLLCFPRALSEQEIIVTKLTALSTETQRLESLYQQKLEKLESLKQSVLQQACSGGL